MFFVDPGIEARRSLGFCGASFDFIGARRIVFCAAPVEFFFTTPSEP
jgi:hypothetical protein